MSQSMSPAQVLPLHTPLARLVSSSSRQSNSGITYWAGLRHLPACADDDANPPAFLPFRFPPTIHHALEAHTNHCPFPLLPAHTYLGTSQRGTHASNLLSVTRFAVLQASPRNGMTASSGRRAHTEVHTKATATPPSVANPNLLSPLTDLFLACIWKGLK